jgi:hypothetical protein
MFVVTHLNYHLSLIVQFVRLNTLYFSDDGTQVVRNYVRDFVFIVLKFQYF